MCGSICEQRAALWVTELGLQSWGCPCSPSQSWDSGLGCPWDWGNAGIPVRGLSPVSPLAYSWPALPVPQGRSQGG